MPERMGPCRIVDRSVRGCPRASAVSRGLPSRAPGSRADPASAHGPLDRAGVRGHPRQTGTRWRVRATGRPATGGRRGRSATGKSHTIANLVAHLLAKGQRVLVTSHTARALEVLRAKVPDEIRELAVVVLGNDVSGREELRASVAGIQRQYNAWNERRSGERVSNLRANLGRAREREATALGQLRAIREADSHRHPPRPGGFEGTAQEIAVELRRRAADYAWLSTAGGLPPDCPLSTDEVRELRALFHELDGGAERELSLVAPDPTALASPEEFAQLVLDEHEAAAASSEVGRF